MYVVMFVRTEESRRIHRRTGSQQQYRTSSSGSKTANVGSVPSVKVSKPLTHSANNNMSLVGSTRRPLRSSSINTTGTVPARRLVLLFEEQLMIVHFIILLLLQI